MRYFLLLLLVSCGGSSKPEPPVIPEIPFIEIYPEFETRTIYYGIYEELNENSWSFKSHIIDYPVCERAEKPSYCRKIQALFEYDASHVSGLETKYSFDFTVFKYNDIDPPYFLIVWQLWMDIDANDNGGNHPIVNLKLKTFDNGLNLVAYNNAWQFAYDFYNPYDPTDPADTEHRHPENDMMGKLKISVNTKYHIEIIIKDGVDLENGESVIFINDKLLSLEQIQTKPLSSIRSGALQFGIYSDREYNPIINQCAEITGLDENICKSNQVKIENFRVFERIVL